MEPRDDPSGPEPCHNRRFVQVAGFFGLVTLVLVVFMAVLAGRHTTYVVDNIAQLAAGAVATAMCALAARRHGQRWTGWALLAGSLSVAVGGNAIWFYYNVVSRDGVVRSSLMGDICAVIALPLAIGAILTFPDALGTVASRLRGALDALLVLTGMFFISWTLVLSPVYQHTSPRRRRRDIQPGLPAERHGRGLTGHHLGHAASGHRRVSLGLVSIGLVWVAGADSSFSYLTALDRYGIGNTTDLGWVLGYFLVALGPCGPTTTRSAPRPGPCDRPCGPWSADLPLLGVLVVAVWQASAHHTVDRVSEISFMAVVLTMSARQFLVLVDHFNLSHQLEGKVEERTLELVHQAYHDGLTGLANRSLFNRYLDEAIEERDGSCTGLVVFLIDLHNFKHVNDLHGHQVGDELLRLVARRLESSWGTPTPSPGLGATSSGYSCSARATRERAGRSPGEHATWPAIHHRFDEPGRRRSHGAVAGAPRRPAATTCCATPAWP